MLKYVNCTTKVRFLSTFVQFCDETSVAKKTFILNEWFSNNRRLSYAHRIMGSPGGKHCNSLQRHVWSGAVSPFQSSVLGQRIPHFAVILWEAEVTNVGTLIVSFCGINAMKSGGAFDFRVKTSVSGRKQKDFAILWSARAPRSRVIALVDSTWVFLLLSFLYRGICLCLKCGAKTSWT